MKNLNDREITLTILETKVYNFILQECMDDYCTSAIDISEQLDMNIKSVKGVVGSLVKKGMVDAQEDHRGGKKFLDLFAYTPCGQYHVGGWGYENLPDSIILSVDTYLGKKSHVTEEMAENSNKDLLDEEVAKEHIIERPPATVESLTKTIEDCQPMLNDAFKSVADAKEAMAKEYRSNKRYVVTLGGMARTVTIKDNLLDEVLFANQYEPTYYAQSIAERICNAIRNGNNDKGVAMHRDDYFAMLVENNEKWYNTLNDALKDRTKELEALKELEK